MPFLGETQVIEPEQSGHHGGGDTMIMAEFAKLVRTASPARYSALLDDVMESHRIAFLAEVSRRTGKTMDASV